MADKIRVVIVDDSVIFKTFLRNKLIAVRDIEVVASFADPVEAMERVPLIKPDVITVDMEMPKMRGNEFIRRVLPRTPGLKAIVISSISSNVFEALQAGAVDFVGKPNTQPGYSSDQFVEDVIEKIRAAASVKISPTAMTGHRPPQKPILSVLHKPGGLRATEKTVIAIGASTGGTEAILEVIQTFPADMPGVVIVQHMPPGFTKAYAERADKVCAMTVREAQNGDRVTPGLVLVAPGGNRQMRIMTSGTGYSVDLRLGPRVNSHCPSVGVLFESVANAAGRNAVGVILTGMGADGAQSLKLMRQAGAHTIGQDEATCIVYGMPKVAFDIGGVAEQLPLKSIGPAVIKYIDGL